MPTLANSLRISKITRRAAPPSRRPVQEKGSPLATSLPNKPDAHAEPPTRRIPLNVFQRLIRGWDEIHPYNAVQVLELRREVDPAAASRAWAIVLEEMRLGRVEVGLISYRHVGLNGEMVRYPVRVLPAGTPLDEYVADGLNQPFEDPAEPPFRPFVLPDPAAGTWHFGVVYQHWVADSVAVRHMLRRWVELMFLPREAWASRPIRHASIGYLGLLESAPGELSAVRAAMGVARLHNRYRTARKVKTFGKKDYPSGVALAERAGLVPLLVRSARRRSCKVNDLFLAAAARVCDTRIPAQYRKRRPNLALASIVDLRPLARGSLDDQFGLFLGFSEVICRPADIASPDDLVHDIARQNQTHRRHGIWPTSVGWLLAAFTARPIIRRRLYHFFRKEAPILAGVSNVNLTRTWPADHPDLIARYRRISPTGPLAPVVFAVTTLGDVLQLSVTYRQALLTADQARDLAEAFLDELAALCAE